MKVLLIIIGILSAFVVLTVLIFSIKTLIDTKRKSGYRVRLNEMCYEDEDADGQDFTYKRTKRLHGAIDVWPGVKK